MSMRVNPRRDSNQYVRSLAHLLCDRVQALDLQEVVHDDAPDADFQPCADLFVRLEVSVEEDPLRGECGFQRGVHLARGDYVEP